MVVVRQPDPPSVAGDVAVRRQEAQQLGQLMRNRGPLWRCRQLLGECKVVSGFNSISPKGLAVGVEHRVVSGHVNDTTASLDAQQLVVRIAGSSTCNTIW